MDKLKKKMDLESIDELISLCEDKMVSPFKKKKDVAMEVELKPEEDAEEENAEKPSLGDADISDLIRMYEEMKSKKDSEEEE